LVFLERLIHVADHLSVGCTDKLAVAPIDPIYDLLHGCPGPVATLAFAGSALNETSPSDAGAFALLDVPKADTKLESALEVRLDKPALGTT
jgi:hypothetical protein